MNFKEKNNYSNNNFIQKLLNGFSQIMLQKNVMTGLLFLAGIALGSVYMALGAILATMTGTLAAIALKFDKYETGIGLYGFSGALVGVATMLFFKPTLIVWLAIAVGGALAAILQNLFIRYNLPVYTFPFVLVTWLFIYLGEAFFPELMHSFKNYDLKEIEYLAFAFKGFGQVIFQDKLLVGVMFFIAVFISSPIAALYGMAASVVSAILATYMQIPADTIGMGLLSFNAVLCAIVFAGDQVRDGFYALLSIVVSLAVSLIFLKYELPQLTFPFVVGAFTMTLIKQRVKTEGVFVSDDYSD